MDLQIAFKMKKNNADFIQHLHLSNCISMHNSNVSHSNEEEHWDFEILFKTFIFMHL